MLTPFRQTTPQSRTSPAALLRRTTPRGPRRNGEPGDIELFEPLASMIRASRSGRRAGSGAFNRAGVLEAADVHAAARTGDLGGRPTSGPARRSHGGAGRPRRLGVRRLAFLRARHGPPWPEQAERADAVLASPSLEAGVAPAEGPPAVTWTAITGWSGRRALTWSPGPRSLHPRSMRRRWPRAWSGSARRPQRRAARGGRARRAPVDFTVVTGRPRDRADMNASMPWHARRSPTRPRPAEGGVDRLECTDRQGRGEVCRRRSRASWPGMSADDRAHVGRAQAMTLHRCWAGGPTTLTRFRHDRSNR